MTKFTTAILAAGMALGTATAGQAAVLDFMTYANGNEHGVGNDTKITFDGLETKFNSSHNAYFDSGNAGLGVCKELTDVTAQCDPSNDDNVTSGEWVTISWDNAQDLTNLMFRAEGHVPLTSSTLLLQFAVNGGTLATYTFAELSGMSFNNVLSATFAYGGVRDNLSPDQFYIQSVTANETTPVPLPASASLVLAGIGALAALRRRKRA